MHETNSTGPCRRMKVEKRDRPEKLNFWPKRVISIRCCELAILGCGTDLTYAAKSLNFGSKRVIRYDAAGIAIRGLKTGRSCRWCDGKFDQTSAHSSHAIRVRFAFDRIAKCNISFVAHRDPSYRPWRLL